MGSSCWSASASSTSASVERPPLGVRFTTGRPSSSNRIFSSWSRDRSRKSRPAILLQSPRARAATLLPSALSSPGSARRRARPAFPSRRARVSSGTSTSRISPSSRSASSLGSIRARSATGSSASGAARTAARSTSISSNKGCGPRVFGEGFLGRARRTFRYAELATCELFERVGRLGIEQVSADEDVERGSREGRARACEDDRRALDVETHLRDARVRQQGREDRSHGAPLELLRRAEVAVRDRHVVPATRLDR